MKAVETPHGAPHKKVLPKDVQRTSFFKGYAPIKVKGYASTSKPIIKSKSRMYIVDSGASLHMMRKLNHSFPQELKTIRHTKDNLDVKTAIGVAGSTTEAKVQPGFLPLLQVGWMILLR